MSVAWRRVGGALVLLLMGTACGGRGTTAASPLSPSGLATSPVGPVAGSATPSPAQTTGKSELTVTQNNFLFDPTKVTVKSGATITVQNLNGTIPHTFTIKSSHINIVNDHGQSTDVVIDLPPGTYTFFCRFHVSLGMKGTIVVT
jgi:plastocyanin